MKSTILRKALAIGLAWLPAAFWLIFAATGVIMGAGGLFSDAPYQSLIFIALGLAGILGFIGLTLTSWTRRPVTGTVAFFLLCGVVSLLVAVGYLVTAGEWELSDPITILQLVYFVLCPVVFGLAGILSFFKGAAGPETLS